MQSNNSEAYARALEFFTDSVIEPDHELRLKATDAGCYIELMEIRRHCLTYLKSVKEMQNFEASDESDSIEEEKTWLEKMQATKIAPAKPETSVQLKR